ncbi:MAG: porin, partial [Pseudomonadota bacterium]
MNIKSFLLGSAAAMIAVTGAQAADAIVVEPEPVEYVRVCDAYGSGFFFIPGTETCIRLGGFVRSSYEKDYLDISNTAGVTTSEESRTFWGQRARLNVDVRNETDYGTLRALYRLEAGDEERAGCRSLFRFS